MRKIDTQLRSDDPPAVFRAFLFVQTANFKIVIGNSLAHVLISITSAAGGAAFAKSSAMLLLLKHFGL